ncbi:MAG UNVERIFIED_CONTAM: hypothetical protein LVR29_21980 [Microcystis novacekii LVE1205-3]
MSYGNVYRQLEHAYSIYGEGGSSSGGGNTGENSGGKPVEGMEELAEELKKAIGDTKSFLFEHGFELSELTSSELKPMEKLGKIKKAVDCVCLNETSRTKFELLAREVFRKYQALYPDKLAKPYMEEF